MIARWIIIKTGELMEVEVVNGFGAFERLVNSHPEMKFLEWVKPQ